MTSLKYKNFGVVYSYDQLDVLVNDFFNQNPDIQIDSYNEELHDCGRWTAYMFYHLKENKVNKDEQPT